MEKHIIYIDPFALKAKPELEYYHGFAEALKTKHKVSIVNTLNIQNIDTLINEYGRPDIIIFGLAVSKQGYLDGFYKRKIIGLAEMNIPKLCFILCYFNLEQKITWMQQHKITHIFSEYHRAQEIIGDIGIPVHRLLFATTPNIITENQVKEYDICFAGALHEPAYNGNEYNLRRRVIEIIQSLGLRTNILVNRRMSIKEYYNLIGKSKIWLCTTSIPDGTIAPRFYELANGKCLILCDQWEHTYDGVFENNSDCIMFKKDLSDFKEKLMHYITHEDERKTIVDRAYDKVMTQHLWNNRVEQVMHTILQ